LDGFLGLSWGSSGQQVKELMRNRPNTTLNGEKPDYLDYKSTFLGKNADIMFCLYQNKLYKAGVFMEFEEYEVIDGWKSICEDISSKYGQPNNRFYFFKTPYEEGDGYEEQAIRNGKGTASAYWDFGNNNIISCRITTSLIVVIAYENGEIMKVVSEANKKKQSQDL
jgi:hypothetical protein